jgi:tripeptide aminopeptidase
MEQIPTLGLIAHVDTSNAVPGAPVNPQVVTFDGSPIRLNDQVTLEPNPAYVGQELIVTDGNTLLGADDKAGIATIVSAVEYLLNHPEIPHGRVALCFTPDEEIGEGPDFFDIPGFGAKTAYTVDGGELGEIEYENFNAAGCTVNVHGINIHPGSAKNVMKNAILIANEFISLLPAAATPAHTEGYEGFFHINGISGTENLATLQMLIRDHDKEKFLEKKALLGEIGSFLNKKYGEGTVEVLVEDSYYNMKEQILPHMYLIENAKAAMEAVGVTPNVVPIRGGTDGARLSYQGLPCPNLSTGGANFHSLREYVPVPSLEKMTEVLVQLILLQK